MNDEDMRAGEMPAVGDLCEPQALPAGAGAGWFAGGWALFKPQWGLYSWCIASSPWWPR